MIQLSRDITSPVHFVELKGNRFGHAIYHPSFTAEASMALELKKGDGTQSDPLRFSSRIGLPSHSEPEQCWVKKNIWTPRLESTSSQEFLMEGGGGGGGDGGPNFDSKTLLEFFCGKLLIPQTSESPSLFPRSRLHPPLVRGNKGCTDVVNINVKVMMQVHACKSREPLLRHPVSEM